MFGLPFKSKDESLDKEIAAVYARMQHLGPGEDEYKQLLKYLERLTKLKDGNKPFNNKINADTVLLVVGNLAGIVIIVAFERNNVMMSKGLSFLKPLLPNKPS